MAAAHLLDHAFMPAHIARQARVGLRMNVLRAHAVARRKARRGVGVALGRAAAIEHLGDIVGLERARDRLRRPDRLAGGDLLGRRRGRARPSASAARRARSGSRSSRRYSPGGRFSRAKRDMSMFQPPGAPIAQRQREGALLPFAHETPARSAPGSTGPWPCAPPRSCPPFMGPPRATSAGRCRSWSRA